MVNSNKSLEMTVKEINMENKKYTCNICNIEFTNKSLLANHIKYNHCNNQFLVKCDYCGKEYKKIGLLYHIRHCHQNPNYVETDAMKLFNERRKEHKEQQLMPGTCSFCGKFCKNQNALKQHQIRCKNNPNKIKLSQPSSNFLNAPRKSWNKGQTKDTNPIIARIAKKLKTIATGHALTKEKEELRRRKISEAAKRNHIGGFKLRSGRGHRGWYKDFFCSSTYELVYVIYNIDHNIKFNRCNRKYLYEYDGEQHYYHPDFELEDGSLVEIKGYVTDKVKAKLNSVSDRPIKMLCEKDLKYAFDYVKENYSYSKLEDLYTKKHK